MVKRSLLAIKLVVLLQAAAAQTTDSAFRRYVQIIPGTTVQFKMTPVPAGTFLMGSQATDVLADKDEQPQRRVQVSAFWMGVHEVTHDEFDIFFSDEATPQNSKVDAVTRPSPQYIDLSWGMGKEGGYPANSMQQLAALMYCRWLYQKTGFFYRLPTEAEWEYACRAGSTTAYSYGDDKSKLDEYAWHFNNSQAGTKKVGSKKPNAWGLYDMHGNVAEWTMDQYDPNYYAKFTKGTAVSPWLRPTKLYPHALRGGSWDDDPEALRSAARHFSKPVWKQRDPQMPKSQWWFTDAPFVGFRVVRPLKQPSPEEIAKYWLEPIKDFGS